MAAEFICREDDGDTWTAVLTKDQHIHDITRDETERRILLRQDLILQHTDQMIKEIHGSESRDTTLNGGSVCSQIRMTLTRFMSSLLGEAFGMVQQKEMKMLWRILLRKKPRINNCLAEKQEP